MLLPKANGPGSIRRGGESFCEGSFKAMLLTMTIDAALLQAVDIVAMYFLIAVICLSAILRS